MGDLDVYGESLHALATASKAACSIEAVWRGRKARLSDQGKRVSLRLSSRSLSGIRESEPGMQQLITDVARTGSQLNLTGGSKLEVGGAVVTDALSRASATEVDAAQHAFKESMNFEPDSAVQMEALHTKQKQWVTDMQRYAGRKKMHIASESRKPKEEDEYDEAKEEDEVDVCDAEEKLSIIKTRRTKRRVRRTSAQLDLPVGLIYEWEVFTLLLVGGLAAVRIQKVYRGHRRRRQWRIAKQKSRAAVVIQAMWRGVHARRRKMALQQRLNVRAWSHAVVQIQTSWRGTHARLRLLGSVMYTRQAKLRTLVALNGALYGSLVRQRMQELLRVRAATQIQAVWRGWQARHRLRLVRTRMALRLLATVRFQAVWRGFSVRRVIAVEAATRIQSIWRGCRFRKFGRLWELGTPAPAYRAVGEVVVVAELSQLERSGGGAWRRPLGQDRDPARQRERTLYRDLLLSLNAEAVAAIDTGRLELGLARLREAERALVTDGARLCAGGPGLAAVEPALQRELRFVTYCNLGMLCARSGGAAAAGDGAGLERWRYAAHWLRQALADPIPEVDARSGFALAAATAELALALQQLGFAAAGVDAQAEAAVQLATRAAGSTPRPLDHRHTSELQRLGTTLVRPPPPRSGCCLACACTGR
jgi:hypothetical protein